MGIDMKPVVSSHIAAIGYDGSTLRVRFTNGTEYAYADVPPEAFDGLLAAKSVGAHFAATIRGRFVHTKLEPEPEPKAE